MPIEPIDFYYSDKIQLIQECFAEEDYRSGIAEAVVLKRNLSGKEKSKYYCLFSKLIGMGYRKLGNWKSALSVLSDADSFAKEMFGKTEDRKWLIEHAVLKANIASVFFSSGDLSNALQLLASAKTIFEDNNDRNHLCMVYESIAEIQTAKGDIESAEQTRRLLQDMIDGQF